MRLTFGRACLDTRISLDVSRQALGDRVGVTARYIALIERGHANPSLRLVEAIADALGLDIALSIRPPIFPAGPHLQDPVHARCSAYVDRRLRALGWATAREVEIVHGRTHGWIDLLAFDTRTGMLMVIEVKTRLDDLGALERQITWYERMALPTGAPPRLAADAHRSLRSGPRQRRSRARGTSAQGSAVDRLPRAAPGIAGRRLSTRVGRSQGVASR